MTSILCIMKECAIFHCSFTPFQVENGIGRKRGKNSPNSSRVTILSNEVKDGYPDHAFYAPPEEEDKRSLPKTCQLFGKWLFIVINVVFVITFGVVSVYFHYNSGVVFGQCRL